jgi:hypothetical protein
MSILHPSAYRAAPVRSRSSAALLRITLGLLFLWGSGVHVGIVSGDPELYRHVADGAWFPGVRTAWREVFMAAPALWGLAVAMGEFLIAVLLLSGGRRTRVGWPALWPSTSGSCCWAGDSGCGPSRSSS